MKIKITNTTITGRVKTTVVQETEVNDAWKTSPISVEYDDSKKVLFATLAGVPGKFFVPSVAYRPAIGSMPERKAADAIPAVPEIPSCKLLVWQGADYDLANTMRNGEGWGQSDLIEGIEVALAKIQVD